MKRLILHVALIGLTLGVSSAMAAGHEAKITKYFDANISGWLKAPQIVLAVSQQNLNHHGLTAKNIANLDFRWRGEKDAGGGELMNSKLNNHLSSFLRGVRSASNGVIVEIFVMDNKGLNVGQTDPTGDYMQGDEAKWLKTYRMGPFARFIDDVEEDGGKNISQTSASIANEKGREIGAITIAIDVDKL